MIRWLTLVAVLFAPAVFADVALIAQTSADLHEQPDEHSAVIVRVHAGAELLVYEHSENGFRQARLPNGTRGYILESVVLPTDRPGPPPVVRNATYVGGVYDLKTLTTGDPLVAKRTSALASRNTLALTTGAIGVIAGLALALGTSLYGPADCRADFLIAPGAINCSYGAAQIALMGGGGLLIAAGLVSYFLLRPSELDLHQSVVIWNARHPDNLLGLPE